MFSALRKDLCALRNLFPLSVSGHAKDALSLAQMQEQTLQLEQQTKLKVSWNRSSVVQPALLRQLLGLWGALSQSLTFLQFAEGAEFYLLLFSFSK